MRSWVGWLIIGVCWGLAGCETDSTPPPLAVQQDNEFRFVENFTVGTTGDWQTEADDFGMTAVLNERMIIEISSANTVQYTTLQEQVFSDFNLEVEVTQLAGHPESSFGILFRLQGPGQFYRFDITGNGRYTVERHNVDGTWTRFVEDWPLSPAIQQGFNVTNRLQVSAVGSEITVYANGEALFQFSDAAYSEGNIALAGGTFGQAGLSVAFDNLVVNLPQ
jgi:hypothetical protein